MPFKSNKSISKLTSIKELPGPYNYGITCTKSEYQESKVQNANAAGGSEVADVTSLPYRAELRIDESPGFLEDNREHKASNNNTQPTSPEVGE